MQARVLLDGLAMPESPQWHAGRPWFSNSGTRQIVAVDLDGNSEVVGEGPDGLGWATNWLPDGRMLITGPELIRIEPDGSRVRHADLNHISPFGWSEITIDGRGNVYVASGPRARPWRTTAPASARAVTCSSGSTSAVRASRPCSAAPTVGRSSCSRPTGGAPRQSMTSSRRERDRCSSSTRRPRRRLAVAGTDRPRAGVWSVCGA
jgi:hypothetical protein